MFQPNLRVKLTPIHWLPEPLQELRDDLYDLSFERDIELQIEHDPSHPKDPKMLHVFYDGHYIGDIRKHFLDKDMSETIDRFCFRGEKLKKLRLIYRNGTLKIYPYQPKHSKSA